MSVLVDNPVFQKCEAEPPANTDTLIYTPRQYPQVVKYMGSKAAILPFIAAELAKVHAEGRPFVDLFAGACAISGGFGHISKIISNDIQEYSAVIASTYLKRAEKIGKFDIVALANNIVSVNVAALPDDLDYPAECTLSEFNKTEKRNRALLDKDFNYTHHLFTRVYSGTWWSALQCVWIDAIREVLDSLLASGEIEKSDFDFGLTCLMHAMAYTSQGTGHYAQYRDAKTDLGMSDINKYRRVFVPTIFKKKFDTLLKWNLQNVVDRDHQLVAMDYRECLASLPPSVVYADPPYAFVHYSRFYHAMETIVKYDYPKIQHIGSKIVKGRYRVDRHQSPFCIKTQVKGAFVDLFSGVKDSGSDLLLSYSNTGMIDIDELMALASTAFGNTYDVWFDHMTHTHMTMGRREDRSRQVRESLIIAKKK
ncbi:DNA adenine methylase [Collimonas sp.]|jgi:adenine-specific DNA-methyltransferase|uniref:DNA adenine methylase n=1 Tax=Collimonas sp. TaxID=1963772 RepID=UPI002C8EF095|nr:DNA adenine methylase [Collimonas sp.]HWX02415.1 DNA adenine methylase [Collimonas sp.]